MLLISEINKLFFSEQMLVVGILYIKKKIYTEVVQGQMASQSRMFGMITQYLELM